MTSRVAAAVAGDRVVDDANPMVDDGTAVPSVVPVSTGAVSSHISQAVEAPDRLAAVVNLVMVPKVRYRVTRALWSDAPLMISPNTLMCSEVCTSCLPPPRPHLAGGDACCLLCSPYRQRPY
jgi:hypothetical protein